MTPHASGEPMMHPVGDDDGRGYRKETRPVPFARLDPLDPADPVAIASDSAPGRILILGAPDSGTTTFLTRLYERCRSESSGSDLRIVPSDEHDRRRLEGHLMDLQAGRWPPSTRDSRVFRFEMFHGSRQADVLAITNASEGALSQMAGAWLFAGNWFSRVTGIVLIVDSQWDPWRTESDHRIERSLAAFMQSVRSRPTSATVPVALVLAKADRRGGFTDEWALRDVIALSCGRIVEGFRNLQISTASAVCDEQSPDGRSIPCLLKAASGLEEPLLFCLYGGMPVPRRHGGAEEYPMIRLLHRRPAERRKRAARRDDPSRYLQQRPPSGWRRVVHLLVGSVLLIVVPLGLLVGIILGLWYLILRPF